MKIYPILLMAIALTSCQQNQKQTSAAEYYDFVKEPVADSPLTPEKLWSMGRIGSVSVAPDGSKVVFSVAFTDIKANKSQADIYIVDKDGSNGRRLTDTNISESEVAFTPDGKHISFVAAANGSHQLFEIDIDGTNRRQVSNVEGGIEGYIYAPDMSKVLYVNRVELDEKLTDIYPDLPLANARLETDLMYRHWNDWSDGKYNHVFVAKYENGKLADGKDIMAGEKFHSPLMPMGGMEQITWSPDGKQIAYTCKKLTGKAAAESTNSNIYIYNTENGETSCVSVDNKGYDMNPQFSADGKTLYWQSMEHDGYESDKNRLVSYDFASRQTTDLTANYDNDVNSFAIDKSSGNIWFTSNHKGCDEIFCLDVNTKEIKQLTTETCDFTSVADAGDILIATSMSMNHPTEIYRVDKTAGISENISKINDPILAHTPMGKVEERWMETTNGEQMHVWVVFPPDFDANKKYPALLFCEGGPQNTVSQFWSLRWNLQLMAANGYIVVAPNRHGLPGFGRAWCDQIAGDYGGQNMQDYFTAIDNVAKESYVDADRLGAVGASYGGFSVYWLAGHHQKRFKAFIAHCGIFNLETQYPTTEEIFFVNHDLGGAPWVDNDMTRRSYAASPHLFVKEWDTPIMVIHGEKDFRIPYTQGMAAFNAAVLRGVPAEFLYFPEECHWVQRPQNSILWHRLFYRWLDKYLK